MKIIPAIDIINGKCVRLTKGDYSSVKMYNEHPLEVAKAFEANGLQYLHLVDLDGAKSKHIVNYKVLESIATHTALKIDFGGGIQSDADARIAFECGASQITGGSIAVQNPSAFTDWIRHYGSEKIILGADVRQRKITTAAWLTDSDLDVVAFIKAWMEKGISQVVCTDVAKDGMLRGPSQTLYSEIVQACKVDLIASGGVSSLDDLFKLKEIGCAGAIVGKAIYEGRIALEDLQGV